MAIVEKLTAIGDAIREKTGNSTELTLDQMVNEIKGISGGGGDTTGEDALITREFTEYTNDTAVGVRGYCFYNNTTLTKVNLSNVVSVAQNAFNGCENLVEINMPSLETVDKNAFYDCEKLTSISLPSCTNVGNSGFYNCKALEEISLPECTYLGNSSFYGAKFLKEATFPKVTTVGQTVFRNCTALTKLDFANVKTFSINALKDASNLTTLIIRTTDFGSNNAQTYANLGTGVLTNTLIEAGTGYIYVPDDRVDDYKTGGNWSTYANQIKPLSEYVEVTE